MANAKTVPMSKRKLAAELRELRKTHEELRGKYRDLGNEFFDTEHNLREYKAAAERRAKELGVLQGKYDGLQAGFEILTEKVVDRI